MRWCRHTRPAPRNATGYYVCSNAQKRGGEKCPAKSIPAPEIERFVVDQILRVGQTPELINATVAQAQVQVRKQLADLDVEQRSLDRDLAHWTTEIRTVDADVGPNRGDSEVVARLSDLRERVRGGQTSGWLRCRSRPAFWVEK